MLKHLPSDKAAGPDGITNRILQASGDQAIDMIYLYMLIIWEVETYPGAEESQRGSDRTYLRWQVQTFVLSNFLP